MASILPSDCLILQKFTFLYSGDTPPPSPSFCLDVKSIHCWFGVCTAFAFGGEKCFSNKVYLFLTLQNSVNVILLTVCVCVRPSGWSSEQQLWAPSAVTGWPSCQSNSISKWQQNVSPAPPVLPPPYCSAFNITHTNTDTNTKMEVLIMMHLIFVV